MKFLRYSRNTQMNYQIFKNSFMGYFLIAFLIYKNLYYRYEPIICWSVFLFLIMLIVLEFVSARLCLHETDTEILEKTYRNGNVASVFILLILWGLWSYTFGVLEGMILVLLRGIILILSKS